MTRSMTGYGRAKSSDIRGLSWIVEVHCVNRKMLDMNIHLAKELLFLDLDLRSAISQVIQRGQITVKISTIKPIEQKKPLQLLKKLKSEWEKAAKLLNYPEETITLSFLLKQMDQCSLQDLGMSEKLIQTELKKTLQKALNDVLKMKIAEGKALNLELKKRLKFLIELVNKIEKTSANAPKKYREKLLERLETVLASSSEDERILREVALYAEKIDVTEEITRLHSHAKQVIALLDSKEKSIGRTLEFLTQEMLREINTIASKSGDLKITQHAVTAKAELEKIREQVQNIE